MKTRLPASALTPAIALAALILCGCSRGTKAANDQMQAVITPAPAVPVQPGVPVVTPTQHVPIAVQSDSVQASSSWVAIKDFTYDQRADFASGAGNLLGMLAGQVAELKAKRASMPSTIETKDWDFAMKEMDDSQAYLKSMIEEAGRATPDTWSQEKDKVDEAWQRAQAAFDKVKITTTS
jgi:hypothetical protein